MMEVERITIMKSLTIDQQEEITVNLYESISLDFPFAKGVNAVLAVLGYKDRIKFDLDKGIMVWSNVYDH